MTENDSLKLVTERLCLEPAGILDLAMLHAVFTDASVRKYLFDNQIIPFTQTEEILNQSVTAFRRERYGLWLIYEESLREMIGVAGLYPFFSEPQPQLLYALLPSYQKKGFATEASRAVIRYAFKALGYEYVTASCDVPNAASVAVMERLGMHWFKEELVEGKPLVFYRITNGSNRS